MFQEDRVLIANIAMSAKLEAKRCIADGMTHTIALRQDAIVKIFKKLVVNNHSELSNYNNGGGFYV